MSFGTLGSWFVQDGFAGDYRGLGSWYVQDHRAGGWIVSSHYHGIQIFRRVFGEVESVAACDSTAGGVSAGTVLMRHRGGAGTSIQWGMPMQGQAFNKTIVSGSEGSVEVESGRYTLAVGSRREQGELPAVDTFLEDLKALVEELEGRRDAAAETADMLRNLRVTMTAERAAVERRTLDVR
jgi:predicted dehydrogenase